MRNSSTVQQGLSGRRSVETGDRVESGCRRKSGIVHYFSEGLRSLISHIFPSKSHLHSLPHTINTNNRPNKETPNVSLISYIDDVDSAIS